MKTRRLASANGSGRHKTAEARPAAVVAAPMAAARVTTTAIARTGRARAWRKAARSSVRIASNTAVLLEANGLRPLRFLLQGGGKGVEGRLHVGDAPADQRRQRA